MSDRSVEDERDRYTRVIVYQAEHTTESQAIGAVYWSGGEVIGNTRLSLL